MSFLLNETCHQKGMSRFVINQLLICGTLTFTVVHKCFRTSSSCEQYRAYLMSCELYIHRKKGQMVCCWKGRKIDNVEVKINFQNQLSTRVG